MPSMVRVRRVSGGKLLLGAVLTFCFYGVVQLPAFEDTIWFRYTTGHPIEYISVGLFFVAIAELLIKLANLRRERTAMRHEWLPYGNGPQPVTSAVELYGAVASAPDHLKRTYVAGRLLDALQDIREKRSADQLEDHLRYLAEQDADRCHASYGTIRVIAWMIPILGFLGTVIGITLAIANITPTQLEASLPQVTGGLAVAFDTTALALSLSIALMLMLSYVEGAEQKLLQDVERHVHRELAYRFLSGDSQTAPFLAHLQATAEAILNHSKTLLEQQTRLWSHTVASLHQQYQETNRALESRLTQMIGQWQTHFEKQGQAITQTAESSALIHSELAKVSQQLLQIIQGEGQLLHSQERLAQNLTLLQQTQAFDETLNSLTAAIHLLTIRNQPTPYSQKNAA